MEARDRGAVALAAAGVLARVLLACLGWTDAASERLELASPAVCAIGAVPLYHLATSLNAAAHQDDAALVQSLCRETTSMVQAVILKIAAKQEAINVKE